MAGKCDALWEIHGGETKTPGYKAVHKQDGDRSRLSLYVVNLNFSLLCSKQWQNKWRVVLEKMVSSSSILVICWYFYCVSRDKGFYTSFSDVKLLKQSKVFSNDNKFMFFVAGKYQKISVALIAKRNIVKKAERSADET